MPPDGTSTPTGGATYTIKNNAGSVRGAGGAATLLDAEGTPRSTLHQVRHTRGTEMIAQRSPLHGVQKTLGHLDPRSTQVYVARAEDQLRHELERHRR